MFDEADALANLALIPQRPVLLGQRYERSVAAETGGTSSVGQQHQREQTGHLARVR
jgi:hypothetical protein